MEFPVTSTCLRMVNNDCMGRPIKNAGIYIIIYLDLPKGAEWMIKGAYTPSFQTAPFRRCWYYIMLVSPGPSMGLGSIFTLHLLSKSTTIHVREVYQSRPMDTTPSLGYMVDVPPWISWKLLGGSSQDQDLDNVVIGSPPWKQAMNGNNPIRKGDLRKRSPCLWITIQTGMILQVETPGCSGFLQRLL